ncbi:hypothetical protein BDF19DRAFT_437461 [Syncephalis fuscata]|nr:hypothetical protein BDF19DRAFT_437461 [Syncephalis fuscata]
MKLSIAVVCTVLVAFVATTTMVDAKPTSPVVLQRMKVLTEALSLLLALVNVEMMMAIALAALLLTLVFLYLSLVVATTIARAYW